MKITVYGGAGVVGGNKIYVDLGDRGAFLDFGEPFDVNNLYCSEFVNPRTGRGLRDYIRLGMLPPLDCYRSDLYPVDLPAADMPPVRVDALFLSHAHQDHFGHAGFLREDIPIIASPMTYAILRASSELGRSDMATDIFDHVVREPKKGEPRVLVATKGKEKGVRGRRWVLTGKVIEDEPDWRRGDLCEVTEGSGQLNGLEYRAFPVDHSIYGATAFALRRGEGEWVIYSGDLRMHGAYGEDTARFAEEAGKLSPKILIVEGTRIGRPTPEREITEDIVHQNCLAAVEEGTGLTIADFSARNYERLDTFIDIARRTGRRMVVTYKDVALLRSVAKADGNVRKDSLWVYRSLSDKDWDQVEKLKEEGWQVADPDDVAREPEEHMLCLSFWDMTKLLDLDWKGGTYVYSNSMAYDLRQTDNLQKLMNWIDLMGFECRGLSKTDGMLDFEEGFHSSGHLAVKDLWKVVKRISPEVVVPVHCALPELFAEHCPVRTVLPEKGKVMDLG
ncbi:MAG TPA: MBL fold metallo-hydrolase [Methanomassiliicoccales archaeon]|nr:MBL fold metallo-hydrolase [Methanomassiliicoccales archaeon]